LERRVIKMHVTDNDLFMSREELEHKAYQKQLQLTSYIKPLN